MVFKMYYGICYTIKPGDGGRSLHVAQRHRERAGDLGSEAIKHINWCGEPWVRIFNCFSILTDQTLVCHHLLSNIPGIAPIKLTSEVSSLGN